MFDHSNSQELPVSRNDDGIHLVQKFMSTHGAALINVSPLLGGQKAERKTLQLLGDIRDAQTLSKPIRRGLVSLHQLLTLEHDTDLDWVEIGFFACIDPMDPVVHELCLLTDNLHELLVQIAACPEKPQESLGQPMGRNAA